MSNHDKWTYRSFGNSYFRTHGNLFQIRNDVIVWGFSLAIVQNNSQWQQKGEIWATGDTFALKLPDHSEEDSRIWYIGGGLKTLDITCVQPRPWIWNYNMARMTQLHICRRSTVFLLLMIVQTNFVIFHRHSIEPTVHPGTHSSSLVIRPKFTFIFGQ